VTEPSNPQQDAAAALEQSQQDQEVELPDPVSDVPLFGAATSPYAAAPQASSGGGSSSSGETVRTLEDLYVLYPKLGEGDWKIHIERTSPRSFRGTATAGFLGECYERLSTAEFAARFGGTGYCVKVLKPTSSGANATKSDYQTVKQFRFRVPGDPTLDGIAQGTSEDGMTMSIDPRLLGGAVPEKVQIEQLRLAEKERERQSIDHRRLEDKLESERRHAAQLPPEHVNMLHQSTTRIMEDSRAQLDAATAFWQQEVERLRSENLALQSENQGLRERASKAERDASDHSRVQESVAVRECKEQYDQRLREQTDRYADDRRRSLEDSGERLNRVESEQRKQLDTIVHRHDDERRQADTRATEERERMREDYRDRVDRVERDKKHEVASLKETHRERIEDLTRATTREIESLRDQTRREVENARELERGQATFVKESAANRVDLIQSELDRVRNSDRDNEARLRDAENKLHREPIQALSEAKDLAMQFGGLVEASSLPGEQGFVDKIAPYIPKLSESLGHAIESIGNMRANNQQARGQHVAPVMQAPAQLPAPQPRYRSAAVGAAPQPTPSPAAGGWQASAEMSNYQSPPIGGAQVAGGPSLPFAPPVSNLPSPVQGGADGGAGVPFGASTEIGGPQSEEANSGAPPSPAGPAAGEQASLQQFCEQLDTVVSGRLMSPEGFGRQVIERLGPEQTAMLLQRFRPADVIQASSGIGAGAVQTRDGQRFVAALWTITTQMVGAHLQQAAAPQPNMSPQPAAQQAGQVASFDPPQPAAQQAGQHQSATPQPSQPVAQQAGHVEASDAAETKSAPSTATEPTVEPGEVPVT